MAQVAIEEGRVPATAEPPFLFPDLHKFWDAFAVLSRRRSVTITAAGQVLSNPIPIAEIVAYLDLRDIRDADTRELYLRWLDHLDVEYLSHQAKRLAKDAPKTKQQAKAARSPRRR